MRRSAKCLKPVSPAAPLSRAAKKTIMGKERFPLEISHRGSVDALLYEISCILDLTLSAAIYPSSKFLTYSYVPARSLCIYIFLPMAKTSNVSTSLVAISADLSGFDKSNQLITTYLSAFTGASNLSVRKRQLKR